MKAFVVATGLANALLAGEWTRRDMMFRARRALGHRPPWLGALVRAAISRFPEPPRDRRDELAALIGCHPLFQDAASDRRAPLHIVRWPIDEPAMAPSPWDVPAAATPGDLARLLDVTVPELDWLADARWLERFARDEPLRNYVYGWQRKSNGTIRVLEAPKSRLKALQRRILRLILDRIPPHPAAHGFRRGHSTLSFAAPHASKVVVVRCDLEDFFSSVVHGRVFGIFRTAGYPEAVARLLAAACTHRLPPAIWSAIPRPREAAGIDAHWRLGRRLAEPHLPQGAPTSPALANLAAYRLDVRLAGLAAKHGCDYTRYADDLAFSGRARAVPALVASVRAIAADEGFVVRENKTRVQTAGQRQSLGGWVVNRGTNPNRAELERLEAILVNCVRRGPEGQNRAGHPDFRAHLRGRIAWVAAARPDRAAKLERWFSEIQWPE